MKALTVRQPWAWAIFHGKDIENRDWQTTYRGPLLIHAAKGMTKNEYILADAYIAAYGKITTPHFDALPRGVILGVVDVVDCVPIHSSPWFMGRYGFVLANQQLFDNPIPIKGALGLWDYTEGLSV